MSNIDTKDIKGLTTMPASQYDGWMREIKAIKPNKQKKWKNYLTDKYGTRTRCKYRNGKIYNWSLITNTWQKVVPLESLNKRLKEDGWCKPVWCSRLSQMLRAGIPFETAFGLEIAMNKARMNED